MMVVVQCCLLVSLFLYVCYSISRGQLVEALSVFFLMGQSVAHLVLLAGTLEGNRRMTKRMDAFLESFVYKPTQGEKDPVPDIATLLQKK
jgi:hypothetical protein